MRYNNTYRTQSTRLWGWDYGTPGLYCVTICTKKMFSWFGEIVIDKMVRNHIGCIALKYWIEISQHHENIEIDQFIIMPNHIHGIIGIQYSEKKRRDVACNVSTPSNNFSKISPKKSSLSSIIRSYKSAVTRHIRKNFNPTFAWQPRFYDHIIRDKHGLENIRRDIENNPLHWKTDHIDHDTMFIKQLIRTTKMKSLFKN